MLTLESVKVMMLMKFSENLLQCNLHGVEINAQDLLNQFRGLIKCVFREFGHLCKLYDFQFDSFKYL